MSAFGDKTDKWLNAYIYDVHTLAQHACMIGVLSSPCGS